MKSVFRITVLLIAIAISHNALAQIKTIKTSGKHILGPCGDTLLLRGVNYAPYNWGWSPNENFTNEIAKTGANCIRLQWYKDAGNATTNATYSNSVYLDSALAKCVSNKLIPIMTLHDETCKNSSAALITLAEWYRQPQILAVLNKYKHTLIINIANEALHINWAGDKNAARTTFKNTYTTIIDSLRKSGLEIPLMIDGTECGTNLKELADVALYLIDADPMRNLIFSTHAYWYAYANNDSATMATELNYAMAKNFPLVIGELANEQDDDVNCKYTLNYKPLLNLCQQKKINWIAYGWYRDVCPNRELSSTGSFNNLTTYGNEIVNNANYGLKNTAIRAKHFTEPGCLQTSNVNGLIVNNSFSIAPNPAENLLWVNYASTGECMFSIIGTDGKVYINDFLNIDNNQIDISSLTKGLYLVQFKTGQSIQIIKFIKN